MSAADSCRDSVGRTGSMDVDAGSARSVLLSSSIHCSDGVVLFHRGLLIAKPYHAVGQDAGNGGKLGRPAKELSVDVGSRGGSNVYLFFRGSLAATGREAMGGALADGKRYRIGGQLDVGAGEGLVTMRLAVTTWEWGHPTCRHFKKLLTYYSLYDPTVAARDHAHIASTPSRCGWRFLAH